MLAWYDNIPILAWLLLYGQCRQCKQTISWLYPFIELLATLLLACLYAYIPHHYFFAYFIFISALIVTIRTDIETMLISRYVTLFLVPVAFVLSWYNLLPISFLSSTCGAAFGYLFLFTINYIFKHFANKEGIGQGDFDLLCFIGSFTGIVGCWAAVTIGSALGSLVGIGYLLYIRYFTNKTISTKIPFGPFLACGAIIYVFFKHILEDYFI